MGYYGMWKPYVSVAARRRKAEREVEKRRKKGEKISPVVVEGRTIAKTFWGKSWCENLERYSDYENRLPRGRTYVRNGSVVDLQISRGAIRALVSGSELYQVELRIGPVEGARWKSICEDCGGAIDSLVELLQGRLSKGVMERICRQELGLFPSPHEIRLACSCPDSAGMCKHVAAVLYGIGARFDQQPELLFLLRGVDHNELIAKAGKALPLTKKGSPSKKVLGGADLGDIFGLDMAGETKPAAKKAVRKAVKKTPPVEDHLARVRRICNSMPESMEKLSHGEPTFFVRKKVFAMCANNHHHDGHVAVWLPAAPGEQEALIAASPKTYFRPPYVGVKGWIGIELERIDDEELAVHIREAWKMIGGSAVSGRGRSRGRSA